MFVPLTLSLLLPFAPSPAVPPASTDDPPVRLKLSDEVFGRGERARVRVKAAKDGYLVVLRADADGRIRVLFPLDPGDDAAVQGGRELEVRGRGDREAFTVDEGEGSGRVLAVWSASPFRFDEFSRARHWDYRALSVEGADDDPEAALLGLVDRMAGGDYEYDVVTYTVSAHPPFRRYGGWYSGWYDPWYDPWFYPCWGCRPGFYGPRLRFGGVVVIGGSSFRGRHR